MRATLASNSGGAHFAIELGASSEYAHEGGFLSSVHLRGHHWDGDQSFPFSTSVDGLWLRAADIVTLQEHIARWVHQPLERLIVDDLRAEFQLARLPGQALRLSFGARSDTIAHRHPVISISFAAGALRGEFHFVTDQSCLSLFSEELPKNS